MKNCKFCGQELPEPATWRERKRDYCPGEKCKTAASKVRFAARVQGTLPPSEPPKPTLAEMVQQSWEALKPLRPPHPNVMLKLADETDLDFRPETQVALFSDLHRNEVIDPRETGGIGLYNEEVMHERLARWRDGVPRFKQTYRFPVPILHIGALGDDMEGHGQIYPAQAYFMDRHLLDQMMGFVCDMEGVLRLFAEIYEQVIVDHVPGNHGRGSAKRNERPFIDNIENIAWMWLRDKMADVPNVTIRVHTSFFALVNILGWNFYFAHGEEVLPLSPYAKRGGMNTKFRMNAVTGEHIDYMCIAHSHTNVEIENEISGRLMVNGAFPGPSMLSVHDMHEATLPSQLIFAVHPKHGITHRTNLNLASADEIRNVKVFGRNDA
jgi:hypothetical protein